jgi:CheY-like chemotaxis protein
MPKWLVVDDEPSICWALTQLGESLGHDVTGLPSAETALQWVQHSNRTSSFWTYVCPEWTV